MLRLLNKLDCKLVYIALVEAYLKDLAVLHQREAKHQGKTSVNTS